MSWRSRADFSDDLLGSMRIVEPEATRSSSTAAGRTMIIDLQVNVESKDGSDVDPKELAQRIKAAGLDGAVLTRSGETAPDLAPYREAAGEVGVKVFAGAKIATHHGLILCLVPSGTTFGPDFVAREGEVYPAAGVIDAIESLGGVTVALRPYDRDVPMPMGDHLFSLQGLVACEVLNGQVSEIANDLALEAASNMEMPCVGTSSARGLEGLGTTATLFRGAVADETELCEAIKHGHCWPVAFSDSAPKAEPEPRRSGGRRGEGKSEGRGEGRRDRNERSGRGRGRGRGGSRSRGRGRGPLPDDIGNRAPGGERVIPEDIGNRVRPESEENLPADDIGNRLRPGEESPFRPRRVDDEED